MLDLLDYWRDFPPTHEILKAVYKIERKNDEPAKAGPSAEEIQAIRRAFPTGFVRQGDAF